MSNKKVFTDKSLKTLVDKTKEYADTTTSSHNTSNDAHANMGWLTSEDEISDSPTPIDADTLNGRDAAYFDSQIAVERARINQLFTLEDDSTTVDGEEEYELIESIVADGSIINRTQEPDGKPYNFKAVFVNLITPTGTLSSGLNMRVMLGNKTMQAWFDAISAAKSSEWNAVMWCERKNGLWWCYNKTTNYSNTTGTAKVNVCRFSETAVTQVVTSASVTAGNILEIWAIRA